MTKHQYPLLVRDLQEALGNYLGSRRLAQIQIRRIEGPDVEGFLTIEGGENGRLLVDFRATLRPQGGFSFLKVGDRKIATTSSMTARGRRVDGLAHIQAAKTVAGSPRH